MRRSGGPPKSGQDILVKPAFDGQILRYQRAGGHIGAHEMNGRAGLGGDELVALEVDTEALAEHFPPGALNPNELPNRLVEI